MGKRKKERKFGERESTPVSLGLIYLLGAAALFTPLLPSVTSAMPLSLTQTSIFQALVVAMVAIWVPLAVADARYRPRRDAVAIAVVVFAAVTVLSLPFSADPDLSFWSRLWRLTGVWNLLHFFAWFMVLHSVLKRESDRRAFLGISCAVALLVSLIAVGQWLGNTKSGIVDSTLGNASFLAGYALLHVFAALYLRIRSSGWMRFFYSLTALACAAATLFSGSRGGVLALALGVVLALFARRMTGLATRRARLAALSVFSIALVALTVGFAVLRGPAVRMLEPSRDRIPAFASRLIFKDFGSDRVILWNYALRGIAERPAFGWGNEMFGYLYDRYYDPLGPEKAVFYERWQDRAHSQYLDVAVSYGLVGLFAFLAIWFFAARKLVTEFTRSEDRDDRREAAALGVLFAVYLVYVAFIFDTPSQLAVLFVALATVSSRSIASPDEVLTDRRFLLRVPLAVAASAVAAFVLVWIDLSPLPAAVRFGKTVPLFASDRATAARELDGLLKSGSPYVIDMRTASVFNVRQISDLAGIRDENMMRVWKTLAGLSAESVAERPYSARELSDAVTAFRSWGTYDSQALVRAREYAERLIALVPGRFDGYQALAEVDAAEGNLDAALAGFAEAKSRVYTQRREFVGEISFREACLHAERREFGAMTESFREARDNGYSVIEDVRLLTTLAKVARTDERFEGLDEYFAGIEKRYGNMPFVRDTLTAVGD